MSIAAAGNWIIDHIKVVDCYPDQDALANILSESSGGGGAPYNLLKVLANTGYANGLQAIGVIGRDSDGERILQDCRASGIDSGLLVQSDEASTSYTDVMSVEGSGRRTFFHHRGANKLLVPSHFDFSQIKARHLHLGYLLLLDGLDQHDSEYGTLTARVLAQAKEHGMTTSIDVVSEDSERFRDLVWPAAKISDIVFMNEFELARTVGVEFDPDDFDRIRWAGSQLANGMLGTLVVHTPDRTVAFLGNGQQIEQGTVRVPDDLIRGTVGAGDAFAAGYLALFLDGLEGADCLRYGCCVAASSLLAADSTSGVLSWKQCWELGDRYGFRGTSQPTV